MNVVIFGKGLGRPRQINLTGRMFACLTMLTAATLVTGAFAGGYWYSSLNGSGVSLDEAEQLQAKVAAEREAIEAVRQQAEDELDALAIRIGQMNARVIRLDALGRRLTEMADISADEFDFDTEPAMGGPEEPTLMTGSAAVPEVITAMAELGNELDSREAQLTVLESVLMNQNLSERVHPQGRPVQSGWMSSYYGRRTDPFTGKPAMHRGVDFAGKEGAEIIAVADGIVTWSATRYGYGEMVEINHGNGYSTRYAHNAENLVEVGQEVRKGEVVALMGDTGRATGPNLHFEVLHKGQRVNPVKFIQQAE
ncbi:MAG: M23 family metallopeptidase [Woeseiaceae bacterium]|nr:M23 family metallopeptidase [Woeseiaceae bacterium]